jgi:hypothetical protein
MSRTFYIPLGHSVYLSSTPTQACGRASEVVHCTALQAFREDKGEVEISEVQVMQCPHEHRQINRLEHPHIMGAKLHERLITRSLPQ